MHSVVQPQGRVSDTLMPNHTVTCIDMSTTAVVFASREKTRAHVFTDLDSLTSRVTTDVLSGRFLLISCLKMASNSEGKSNLVI